MLAMVGLRHVEQVMGTAVSIDVRGAVAAGALEEVIAWLHHVDAVFSPYDPASAVSRIGRGELLPADAGPEVAEVLDRCERARQRTAGAFDVHAVRAPTGALFDPSGLVKGWAVERAAELLGRAGAEHLCLNAGGDVALRGEASRGEPWRVGIRHPEHENDLALVLRGRGPLGIATSATYERGAHIIDPRTGEPTTELASVTVVAPTLTDADTFATAVFVMGLDGLTWLQDQPGCEGYAIDHDGRGWATPGLARYR
jgi:thiamine biosynthesis lipoprotein